jgi:ketosteroid isomerase-like protein
MRILKQAALLCCGLLALAAASIVSAGDDSSPDATFRAGTAEWIAAYNAGNVDRILALYAEDAMVMPPEAPVASGHAAIREFLTKDIASSKAAGITLTDISSGSTTGTSGDLGWHTGTFAVLDANGKTVGTGKYSEIWQRNAGKWMIIRDMWNNDAPAAAPAAPAATTP